jgi:YVTN family beta-propeller protein
VEFRGRPVDLVLSPDGKTIYAKSNAQLLAIDAATWTIRQELKYPAKIGGNASMHGIAVTPDGSRVYSTGGNTLLEARVAPDGSLSWTKPLVIPGSTAKQTGYPCGLALLPGKNNRAVVCLSMNNSLAIVNLTEGKVEREIAVSTAPYDVAVSRDGKLAYVSNWGGRRPREGDKTAKSADSDVVVDDKGTAGTGTLSVVDLAAGKQIAEIPTGLHPADVELSADDTTVFVANANSDTVSVIDTSSRTIADTIAVRPDPALPFGSASNAIALSKDGKRLFVANGGNNAVAVVALSGMKGKVEGFIPTGWYPGGLVTDGQSIYIANIKGIGSRDPADAGKWNSHSYRGSVTKVSVPDDASLARFSEQVRADALVPQSLKAWEKGQTGRRPAPVPRRVGEPSVFEHVVYIIKENRTYDQYFGDITRGNGDPKLCTFGRNVSPNHHALVEQFALLDNFYCNGVNSADGHAWATEGLANDYLEKSFGGFARSYPFSGDDPLAFAPTGFIWDNALLHGLSFRNYGEMSKTQPVPASTWSQVYRDYLDKGGKIRLEHKIWIDALRQYSCPDSPGWNLKIPDMIRADVFLKEFREFEANGGFPNLVIIFLPSDHTSGTNPNNPSPAAQIADNDLALGRIVDAISHSKFWPKTCVFAIEDDPQAGFDHVDGHRSICVVASPYTKRGAVVSNFYNQTSVLHTMELMLGLPPMNQMDSMAPAMRDVFTKRADLKPFRALPNNIPLDQMNAPKEVLSGLMRDLAKASEKLPLDEPDQADENTLNRIVWHSIKGPDAPYPSEYAGAHGRGLKKLNLKLDTAARDDDD